MSGAEDLYVEVGELLSSGLPGETVLRTFCHRVLSWFGAERASLLELGPSGEDLLLRAWAGRYPEDIRGATTPVGEGVAGWVAATGEPLLVEDADRDPRFASLARSPSRYRTRTFLAVPLKERGRTRAVLCLADPTRVESFTRENLRTLEALAFPAALALEGMSLRAKLDSALTGFTAMGGAMPHLAQPDGGVEEDLLPGLLDALSSSLGPHPLLVLLGDGERNLAWLGRIQPDRTRDLRTMDLRVGFLLFQSLTALPLRPPFPADPRLLELGLPLEEAAAGRRRLLRSLLPPRGRSFGCALAFIPPSEPEVLEPCRQMLSVLLAVGGMAVAGKADREKVRRLDEMKSELLSNLSHEMRTPLTSIQGFADFLLRGEGLGEEPRKYLGIISGEARRLGRLLEDFLGLARLEAGDVALVKEPFDPLELGDKVVRLLAPQAAARGATLRFFPGEGVTSLTADRDRVEQVLVNLVGNALRHGGQGVKVAVAVQAAPDGRTLFSVADDGHGIPEDELPRIFDRFYRGEAARASEEEKGSGLGLALAREIVERHGGALEVESAPGRTVFRASFPSFGLAVPHRGILPWRPSDDTFTAEVARRLGEGKTVGVLAARVVPPAPRPEDGAPADQPPGPAPEPTVEDLAVMQELALEAARTGGGGDELVQPRPPAEFLLMTYASALDRTAANLCVAFDARFRGRWGLAVGGAAAEQGEDPARAVPNARQACSFVEQREGSGYLKNRRN